MQEFDKQENTEPVEIQELKGILQAEYPNIKISYTDFRNVYETIKESNPNILISEDKDETESFIDPIGRVGGHFRTELFMHSVRNPLPDPVDPNSKILMYPSFDKDKKLSKLRLLKYPTKLLDDITKEFEKKKDNLKLPSDVSRVNVLPKIRVGFKNPESTDIMASEPILNSTSGHISRYPAERISSLKNSVRNVKWGSRTVPPYKNKKGENILLVL